MVYTFKRLTRKIKFEREKEEEKEKEKEKSSYVFAYFQSKACPGLQLECQQCFS